MRVCLIFFEVKILAAQGVLMYITCLPLTKSGPRSKRLLKFTKDINEIRLAGIV